MSIPQRGPPTHPHAAEVPQYVLGGGWGVGGDVAVALPRRVAARAAAARAAAETGTAMGGRVGMDGEWTWMDGEWIENGYGTDVEWIENGYGTDVEWIENGCGWMEMDGEWIEYG